MRRQERFMRPPRPFQGLQRLDRGRGWHVPPRHFLNLPMIELLREFSIDSELFRVVVQRRPDISAITRAIRVSMFFFRALTCVPDVSGAVLRSTRMCCRRVRIPAERWIQPINIEIKAPRTNNSKRRCRRCQRYKRQCFVAVKMHKHSTECGVDRWALIRRQTASNVNDGMPNV